MLRELHDREGRAQNEERVKHCFENAAAFLFRANQESICGFELRIHKVIWLIPITYCNRRASLENAVVSHWQTVECDFADKDGEKGNVPRLGISRSVFGTAFPNA